MDYDGLPVLEKSVLTVPKRKPTRREMSLRDIGGVRITNDTYPHSVPVPENAEFFMLTAEGGDVRLEINEPGKQVQANSTSTFIGFEEAPSEFYPIAPGQSISCWGAATTYGNFRFLGRVYPDPE